MKMIGENNEKNEQECKGRVLEVQKNRYVLGFDDEELTGGNIYGQNSRSG